MSVKDERVAQIVRYIWHVDYGCPPFISAPTYETDGIVLEWVQANWQTHMKKWDKALFRMWRLKFPQVDERKYLFMNYRVGDYAKAVLAIQEER